MHDPYEPHLTAMKRILRYLQGTPDYSLLLHRSSSSDLVVYTDADWAGCLDTHAMLGTELSLSSRGTMTLGVGAIFWFISHTVSCQPKGLGLHIYS
jgi:hypothetical protein